MYQVIKDNAVMAYVGDPVFIRMHTNGCYVPATEDEAQGYRYPEYAVSYPW